MSTHSSPVLKLAGLTAVRRYLATRAHRQGLCLDAAVRTFFDVEVFDFFRFFELFICFLLGIFNHRVLRGLRLATGFFVTLYPVVIFQALLVAVAGKPTEECGRVELHKENDTLRQLRKYYTLGGSGDWFARDNLSSRPLRKD